MLKLRISCVLLLTLVLGSLQRLRAQEPPPEPAQITDPNQQGERIVDGRPRGYFLKRALHPLSWVDAGVLRPVYRLGSTQIFPRISLFKPGPLNVGVGGAGPSSGFGPLITPFSGELFGNKLEIETPLLYTYKRYEVYKVNLRTPISENGPLGRTKAYVSGAYRSRPVDKFFGLGNDSSHDNESYFRTVHREAAGGLSFEINKNLTSSVQLSFENVGITNTRKDRDVQDVFSEVEVPGLFTGSSLRAITVAVDHDTKDDQTRPTRGGVESVEVSLKEGIGKGDFAYWNYRLDFQRFFAISRDDRQVIAIRGLAETNQEKGGSRVPFYDMPFLGSWGTLRGFDNYRFRDKSALALGLEYRYGIWRALDWGFFLDGGQVGAEPGDFAWDRFHKAYGVRLIMLPTPKFPISADFGRSNEQWRMYINFGTRF